MYKIKLKHFWKTVTVRVICETVLEPCYSKVWSKRGGMGHPSEVLHRYVDILSL